MKKLMNFVTPLVLITALLLPACSSSSRYEPSGNPLLDLRNPELLERDRIAAARAAWAEVEQGVRDRERTRYALKNLAWSGATERELRLVVLDLLLSDTSEQGGEDSRSMARLILPNEREPEAVRIIAYHAVEFGWDDLIPAFVRSLSRHNPDIPDRQRPEYAAIQRLSNTQAIEQVVFDVFLNPSRGLGTDQERAVLRTSERTRDDAWGLLGRLDPTGSIRVGFLESAALRLEEVDEGSRELLMDLRAAQNDLGVLPDTSMEIAWLRSLRRHENQRDNEQNKAWWAQTTDAVNALSPDQRDGLRIRHLEPIRWAHQNRQTWFTLDQEAMYGLLSTRLRGRVVHKRKSEKGEPPRQERLGDWSGLLCWGDLLTILVVDEAITSTAVQEQLFKQRALDKKDTSTEYGGIIETDPDSRWRAVLFRPRQRDRISDQRFVASDDMFRFSDRALAHYHFHADKRNNTGYAGPSIQDLQNAATSQRTSVVLTSMGSDELNVDVYFGLGVVVDLGVILGSGD
ncbi:MAG: hypothetical protein JJ916_02595 [Phycisphaerales bacterium]|nr:hypothetical protein [Phycisphaerales bacterium]